MAVATTIAVASTAVAVKGQRDAKKAQKKAARGQAQANIESADILAEAGAKGAQDIFDQSALAAKAAGQAATSAEEPLRDFANTDILSQAQDSIIGNLPISGAFADSIRSASTEFVRSRPEFNLTDVVSDELGRQSDLAVGAAQPQFNQSLLNAGQEGFAAAADIGQIRQRGFDRLGAIAGAQGAQAASALSGQTSQLADLASGASDARLLGQIVGQNSNAQTANTIAGLGGQLLDPKAGLLRTDEFGFRQGQDPFASDNFK